MVFVRSTCSVLRDVQAARKLVSQGCVHAERWYYMYNEGLQNQSVVYSCQEPGGPKELFYDPNTLSADGTTALSVMVFSKDGAIPAQHDSSATCCQHASGLCCSFAIAHWHAV